MNFQPTVIGFAGGNVNLFAYVPNNPLRYSDPTGLDGWGNDFADWLDRRIEYARGYWHYDDQEWFANGVNDTVADVALGFADLFRVGSGLGHALYDCDENIYGRAAYIAMDVARAAALFELLGNPAARLVPKKVSPPTAPPQPRLRRPYVRNGVRQAVEDAAPRTADGRAIDPNTRAPIDGKPDLGHKYGNEFWRERAQAEAEGLTQKEFNDRMNDPNKYQLEDPSSNRSHRYEKKP